MSGGLGLFFLAAAATAKKRKEESLRRDQSEQREKDVNRARFGNGPLVGKTGDPFIDDPFFNPWAPGGSFSIQGKSRGGHTGASFSPFDDNEECLSAQKRVKEALSSNVLYNDILNLYTSMDRFANREWNKNRTRYSCEYDERDFKIGVFEQNAEEIKPQILNVLLHHISQSPQTEPLLIPDYGFNWSYGSCRDNTEFVSIALDIDDLANDARLKPVSGLIEQAVRQQVYADPKPFVSELYSYNDDPRDHTPVDKDKLLDAYNRGSQFLVKLSHCVLGTGANISITDLNDYFENRDQIQSQILRGQDIASNETEEAIRRQWMCKP